MSTEYFEVTIVVNGHPIEAKVEPGEEISEVVQAALKASGNTGQPADQWELRDESGQILESDKKVGTLDIKPGAKLFLSLKAGVGGFGD